MDSCAKAERFEDPETTCRDRDVYFYFYHDVNEMIGIFKKMEMVGHVLHKYETNRW